MQETFRILSLQPFYGGSHRQMMEGWIAGSRHEWTVLSLPARSWKWRMRHAAIDFARKSREILEQGETFDAVFCTDMMNVAEFRGLAESAIARLPTIVYFHENQFTYPVQPGKPIDMQPAFTNLISMIAADATWFNSEFNRSSMHDEIEKKLKQWPDFAPRSEVKAAFERSTIQSPGIEYANTCRLESERSHSNPIHLVWAARWEYDKGPESLLEILRGLADASVDFRVSVVGQHYKLIPDSMKTIEQEFASQIVDWGFQESRDDYWRVLSQADVFLSTAIHEFFGISAAEAITAGCIPLLPNRLAYPELLDVENHPQRKHFLYDGTKSDCIEKLQNIRSKTVEENRRDANALAKNFVNRFGWTKRTHELDAAIATAISVVS